MSLVGKKIVFTGTLSMPRKEATAMAIAAGATVMSAVSGATNILVAGPGAGSKLSEATSKGMQVMTEEEFTRAAATKKDINNAKSPAAPPAKTPSKKAASAAPKSSPSSLIGKTVVFTGTLSQKRTEAQAKAAAAGRVTKVEEVALNQITCEAFRDPLCVVHSLHDVVKALWQHPVCT